MDRKLASIQRILKLEPILNADSIEKATVLGWEVVVRKGEFKVDDLVIYCEIDSVLPQRAEFEFLRDRNYRIKTVKLRKTTSQGICFPLNIIPIDESGSEMIVNPKEGLDVTDILGVIKYEPIVPAQLAGIAKGNFPAFIPKTDEIRIQEVPQVLERHKWVVLRSTEKLDGCLDGNTTMETEDGIKTIKDICENKYRGKVKSLDIDFDEIVFEKITNYSIKELKVGEQWFEIELENSEKLRITGNHEIWLPELRCYRKVKDLIGNETLLLKK